MQMHESQINGRIAEVIDECVIGTQWVVRAEITATLDQSDRQPDILITRQSPEPPVVIENKYAARDIEAGCLRYLGQVLRPELGGQTVHTVIGVVSPKELRDSNNGAQASNLLRNGVELRYAAYSGTPDEYVRFPESGFISGSVRNLVEFLKPASEPADLIRDAANTLADGASIAARSLIEAAEQDPPFGVRIAEKLRQPWPIGDSDNPKQASADQKARRQTANMATTIIINALAYQQNLDGYAGIEGLAQIREKTARKRLTKDAVVAGFDQVLNVNFWPIFHIAKEMLLQIPASTAQNILEQMAATADQIIDATRHNDIAGTVFQRLIADRETLKTYYTMPEATTLLTHLAIPDDQDWSDPEILRQYRIADYACGSGGIMLAAYQRVRDLHRLHGGSPEKYHNHMMQECLTACDIMPAAVHLTASLLSSVSPTSPYQSTRCILFPFGGQRKTDDKGQLILDDDGNPEKLRTRHGRPVVNVGSLTLLKLNGPTVQTVLPVDEEAALSAHGERTGLQVVMTPASQSLVAMNPPFTRATKHAPFGSTDHVEPRNPAFAAFGTTDEEQSAMKRLAKRLGKDTISDGNAGLGTTFTAIANNMVQPGGHVALILPTSALLGGSHDAGDDQNLSWQSLRNLLCDLYDQIVVVSIAQPDKKASAFSADSNFADCMVIARRIPADAQPSRQAHFVNLKARPSTKLEAQETARAIKRAIKKVPQLNTWERVKIGDDEIGFVMHEAVVRNQKWTTIRISNPTFVLRVKKLSAGKLQLPRRARAINVPMVSTGAIAQVGPVHRDITARKNSPFRKQPGHAVTNEYPMLWNHAPKGSHSQRSMLTEPDSHGDVKPDMDVAAVRMWDNHATHLHINGDFQFNGNSTAAAFTPDPSLGGRAWPTLKLASLRSEKALCVWLNSTLGLMCYWIESNRNQNGRGGMTVTAIPNMPILDVTKLSEIQIDAAVQIFDDLKAQTLLPANEAWHDPVRQELDSRLLTEVFGLDDGACGQLHILRLQWCNEPTVTSTKKTGPA